MHPFSGIVTIRGIEIDGAAKSQRTGRCSKDNERDGNVDKWCVDTVHCSIGGYSAAQQVEAI
jgi:hypothetical protein